MMNRKACPEKDCTFDVLTLTTVTKKKRKCSFSFIILAYLILVEIFFLSRTVFWQAVPSVHGVLSLLSFFQSESRKNNFLLKELSGTADKCHFCNKQRFITENRYCEQIHLRKNGGRAINLSVHTEPCNFAYVLHHKKHSTQEQSSNDNINFFLFGKEIISAICRFFNCHDFALNLLDS